MKTVFILLALFLAGCATTGGISKGIMVYSEESALLNRCETIAPVEAAASAISHGKAMERARRALTEHAAAAGGDGVVILGIDAYGFASATAHGIAVKCFNKSVAGVR